MSILTANLKNFYQCRGLWLGYFMLFCFVFAAIAIPLDDPEAGEGTFIGFNIVALLVGLMASVMQMEIMTRPFAFGLPGHRQMVRKFIFLVAMVTSALGSLIFLFYPGLSLLQLPLVICSAFFAGMIFYLAGAWWAFGVKQPIALIGFAMCALFLGQLLNLHVLLESAIVNYPIVIIPLGILAGIAMWLRLSDSNLSRRNCLQPWIGFDAFNLEKVKRNQANRWKLLKDHPRPWVENLFINTMSRQNPLSRARILWGTLYTSLGLTISQWRNGVGGALFVALFLGYFGPRAWIVLSFIPIVGISTSRPIIYSHMLIAGGRRERFYSTVTHGLVGAMMISLFVAFIILISALLNAFMPDINYHGLTRPYDTVGIEALYAPLVVLPFAYAVYLVLYKKTIAVIVIFLSVYSATVSVLMTSGALAAIRGTLPATCIAILSWLIFVFVSHRISERYCLVK